MARNQSLITFCLILLGCCFAGTPATLAQEKEIKPGLEKGIQQLTSLSLDELLKQLDETWGKYEKKLQAVVEARLIEEREFVAQVTLLIQKDQLPKKHIHGAFVPLIRAVLGNQVYFL